MLSAEDRAQLEASVAAIEAVASQLLTQAKSPWQALAFVATLHNNLDRAAAGAVSPVGPVECRAGCSHCCHSRVELTDPEALHIAEHVRQWPEDERASLVLRLHIQARHHSGDQAPPPLATRPPCAFLADHRCSIYAWRPSTCRKGHSLSAQACEDQSPTIPQSLDILVRCEALMAGARRAYQNNGLPAAAHELAQAVLAALQQPGAVADWYQGQPLLRGTSATDAQDKTPSFGS